MRSLRRHRFLTVLFALFALLFTQLAVAAYACPGAMGGVQEMAAMAQAEMPCAGSMVMAMDDAQPALCHAHCQAGQQSSDHHLIQMPAVAPSGGLVLAAASFAAGGRSAPQASLLARATAPPLAIRNCCFRI